MTRDEFARGLRAMEGPAWRYRTAVRSALQTGPGSSALHDGALSEAVKYRRLLSQGGEGLARTAYPTIFAAERLNEDPDKTAPLKLMVLADFSSPEMHSRTGVEIAVLEAWEALFFDARDQRQATAWLAHHVVDKERTTGDPRIASKLKMAILVGPIAVRGLLDHDGGKCLDEADRLFQRKLILNAKFDAAVEMPIDSEKSRLAFIKFQLQLTEGEKRLALAERRLAQRCAETSDQHELAKMRLARTAEIQTIDRSERLRRSARKAMRAAMTRHVSRETSEQRLETERRERHARAAASPLAQLTWAANNSPAREVVSPAPRLATPAALDAAGGGLLTRAGGRSTEGKDAHGVAA